HTAITDNVIDPNRRWVDVADATVETSLTKEVTPNGGYGVAAKINYYNGNAKSITFAEGTLSRKPQNETGKEVYNNNFNFDRKGKSELNLRLTSTTRYFVADVLRNQLTEVKNVDEAIRILGNTTASNWFLDVYAGYENHSGRKPYETSTNTVLNDYNEATVVVFNAVQRDNNNAQLLRVKNEATTKYDITFENEKGEVVVNNVTTYRNYFPFNFNTHNDSAKLDVVEYTVNNAYGLEAEMIIDHSNTGRYPIVEVIGIQGRDIIVRGEFGETAVLQLDTDYALFLRGQLKVGALIQFHTLTNNVLPKDNKDVNKTNVVDVVSVMPANAGFTVRGSLRKVVEGNQANQSAGVVALKDFTDYGAQYQKVILSEIRNLYVASQYNQLGYFVLNNTEANALKAWLEAKPGKVDTIRFKVKPFNGYDKEFEIYDIEVLKDSNWVEVRTLVKDKLAELREAVRVLANKYPTEDSVTNENVFKFEEELNAVKALVAALVFPEDAAWNATDSVNGIYFNKLDTMKGWNLDAKKQAYVDNKADGVVANLPKEVKVAHNHETDTKAVKAAVKLAIEKYLNDSSITVEITSPADGDAITNPVASIKFKLTKGGKTSAEKELTNIAVSALN
ncbi:hypothetical protein, partial [Peptoniphilus sp. oral taxon 386]|uniref:hypothetical protein n=2 Tax=Peptoniphilus sp. oral taxon 386 TaxID=652713 RepID=UPI0005871E55